MNAALILLCVLVFLAVAALRLLYGILATLERLTGTPAPGSSSEPAPKRPRGRPRKPKAAPSSSSEPADPRQIPIEEPK
jgi:hypothetical protein